MKLLRHFAEGVGGDVDALPFHKLSLLHRAATTIDHPLGTLVTMATLMPSDAGAIAAARIELIDWRDPALRLDGPAWCAHRVAMGAVAAAAALDECGDRTEGFLIEDGHGAALAVDADAEDYARELVADAFGGVEPFPWTFRAVREGVFGCMVDGDVPFAVAQALAGLGGHDEGGDDAKAARLRTAFADLWSDALMAGRPIPCSGSRPLTGMVLRMRAAMRGRDLR